MENRKSDQIWRQLTTTEREPNGTQVTPRFGAFAPNGIQRALITLCRATILKRGKARAAMAHLVYGFGQGAIDVSFRGAAFRLHCERNLTDYALLMNPDYNRRDIDFLIDGAPKDACFADLGSNIGLYAQPMALAAPYGITLAVDANPKMVAQLKWNATASDLGNVKVTHAGLSDKDGMGDLQLRKNDLAIVSVNEDRDGGIPLRRLDTLLAEAGLKALYGLKIDIEGHEDKVLPPFLDTAPKTLLPRRIVIEHLGAQGDYHACVQALSRHGYKLVGRTRNNALYMLETA